MRKVLPDITKQQRTRLTNVAIVISSLILVGCVIIPAGSRIRGQQNLATCMSNVRELGIASMAYAQDYNRCFPQYVNTTEGKTDAASDPANLVKVLTPYLKGKQPWFCPSDDFAGKPEEDFVYHKYSSYDFGFKSEGKMGLDGELRNGIVVFEAKDCPIVQDCAYKTDSGGCPMYAGHLGTINVFWADGHYSTQML